MRNIRINAKILLGFGVGLIGLIIVGLFSLAQMKKLNSHSNELSNNRLPSIMETSGMSYDKEQIRNKE